MISADAIMKQLHDHIKYTFDSIIYISGSTNAEVCYWEDNEYIRQTYDSRSVTFKIEPNKTNQIELFMLHNSITDKYKTSLETDNRAIKIKFLF